MFKIKNDLHIWGAVRDIFQKCPQVFSFPHGCGPFLSERPPPGKKTAWRNLGGLISHFLSLCCYSTTFLLSISSGNTFIFWCFISFYQVIFTLLYIVFSFFGFDIVFYLICKGLWNFILNVYCFLSVMASLQRCCICKWDKWNTIRSLTACEQSSWTFQNKSFLCL